MQDTIPIFEVDGVKTLPIYLARFQLQETLKPFDKAEARIILADPEYIVQNYNDDSLTALIARDAEAAIRAIEAWSAHVANYLYFVQIKDDPSRNRIASLHRHTEVVSTLCDSRLGMDPTELWCVFDGMHAFEAAHTDYRADPDRDAKRDEYAARLLAAHKKLSDHQRRGQRLIQRMVMQTNLRAANWNSLPSIVPPALDKSPSDGIRVFYSYSHKDEKLRVKLETHLAMLTRQRIIGEWHDRKITAGAEWKNEIDRRVEEADVILLLVSAYFLASDYCYDIELKRAIARHSEGTAKVIPIILRDCDWSEAPFASLQALPTDAKPVTSWTNRDKAFSDIAKGIRRAVEELASRSKSS